MKKLDQTRMFLKIFGEHSEFTRQKHTEAIDDIKRELQQRDWLTAGIAEAIYVAFSYMDMEPNERNTKFMMEMAMQFMSIGKEMGIDVDFDPITV